MDQEELNAKMTVIRAVDEAQQGTPKRKKVAILGFTETWKLAPFDDPEFEIWGLNELYQFIPRWDRWFEIHSRAAYEADKKRIDDHVGRLKQMTCPIYMQQHWEDIPNSVPYPLEAVSKAFPNPAGDSWRPYLTNSISYMIALAILEEFVEIHVYGVDMSHDCLAPDMRVLTADLRWVPVSELTVGQELLAFDEEMPVRMGQTKAAEFRKYRKTRVESLSQLTRPCHTLTMADGTQLTASVGHKWLTIGGLKANRRWLETKKLQGKDVYPTHASKIVKVSDLWVEDRSWDAGYLAGAFDGEGHVSQGKRTNCQSSHMSVGFAQRDNEMNTEVDAALRRLGFKYFRHSGDDNCNKYNIQGGRHELLRFLGSVRPRRLLANFDATQVGTLNHIADVPVLKNEPIGEQPVIGITTTTGTLIVEGYASHNSEYGHQKPSCEYYVGVAQGRGIKVYIPPQSDLLKTVFLYGFEEPQAIGFDQKLHQRLAEYKAKLAQLQADTAQRNDAIQQYLGAIQDTEQILKNWRPELP